MSKLNFVTWKFYYAYFSHKQ